MPPPTSTHVTPGRLRRRYSPHSFLLTILVLSILGLVSYVQQAHDVDVPPLPHATLRQRDASPYASTDEECRLVRHASDQCAYISKHCPDEDPGFYSYLSLYYCDLGHVKPVAFAILVSWLGLLFSTIGIAASDFFCINLSTIATILGMSESMAGVTFLAFGNGSPDVFSTFAAFSTNSSSLAIGELFGAAGFITAVVAGSMALVRPFKVAKRAFIRDVGFFAVSASFSLVFLWDGRLHLWECIVMVLFYVFYVVFVVIWHWRMGRRRKRRERDQAARGHFIVPGSDEVDAQEDYHDEDDDQATRPTSTRGPSNEDFSALERGGTPVIIEPDEDDDEARDRWLGELSSNMRLNRPTPGSRRNTLTPIRPSLVGALEFQAVLKSLQKSRHHQTIPMYARRYSDDPAFTTAQQQEHLSAVSDPASRPPYHVSSEASSPIMERPAPEIHNTVSGRTRAVSANDAAHLRLDPRLFPKHSPKLDDLTEDENGNLKPPSIQSVSVDSSTRPTTPEVTISDVDNVTPNPWDEDGQDRETEHESAQNREHSNLLGLPDTNFAGRSSRSAHSNSPHHSPRSQSQFLHKLLIPASSQVSPRATSPSSPFPDYREPQSAGSSRPPSIYLPPASVSVESQALTRIDDDDHSMKPLKWWPYMILPPPTDLLYRLLPTFEHWRSKNWWERLLSVIAAPSMFLLIVTLPVVESEREEEEDIALLNSDDPVMPYSDNPIRSNAASLAPDSPEIEPTSLEPRHGSYAPGSGVAAVATNIEHNYLQVPNEHQPLLSPTLPSPHPSSDKGQPRYWNRWLTIVQLFLAPLLIVLVIYTQYLDPPDSIRPLIRPILISLLVSFILLIPLLLTTTPTHRPKPYNTILSLAGFVVSIAWISTIASQVVAVLKALAVILNMSHAIMGLTIFAVGNSLGDLVADITVAKLGYPIMALSACFGGPMLNILLGIGLSGCWILIRGAAHRHHKHPDKEIHFRTYEIEVGQTLIVSGFTLLVTLLGLLIAVPWNNWVLSKKIGWSLIGVWCVSTVVNVLLEVIWIGDSGGGKEAGVLL